MQQRGRKSAAELASFSVNGDPPPLEPPPSLNDAERLLFAEIVEAVSPRHFLPTDQPLLASYCQAVVISREAAKYAMTDQSSLLAWEKATRVQAQLAGRLRLSPSSRYDPKTAARMPPTPRRPRLWEDDGD
jgi:hypothetical protein